MNASLTKLPGLLAEIEQVAGRPAALAIAIGYGGTRQKFPSPQMMEANGKRYLNNWLVKTVGSKRALAIVREIFPNGGQADIPSGRSAITRQYVQDNAGNLSVSEMASFLENTERNVRRIKASLRDEGLIT